MKEDKKSGMENNNYKQLINESYEKFTDDVDIMWQKSGVGDLDDFIYDGLIISGYDENNKWFGRLPTEEEFINKVKSDEGFSKRWGIKIEERKLKHQERVELSWTVFFPDRQNESVPDWWNVKGLSMDEKNVPTKEIKVTYDGKTEIGYE
jgi:hypothetical protein